MPEPRTTERPAIPPLLDQAAGWSWRLVVVAGAIWLLVWMLAQVKLVVIPVVAALIATTVLVPAAQMLRRRGVPQLVATWLVMTVFIGTFVGVVAALAPAAADEFTNLDETVEDAVDDIEEWLVTGPLGLDAQSVADWRRNANDSVEAFFDDNGAVAESAILVGEAVTGVVLALVVTFFLVKDGERLVESTMAFLPARSRPRARVAGEAAWRTLGGYLRGSAMLGAIEGVIIGTTLAVVGAELVLPIAALTFLAAFFPFVGAIMAGVLAVLVTLVTAGFTEAVIVAVVAFLVQQFDNDLLAPVIFGRYLRLHPIVIIVVLTSGAVVGGISGAFLAVPVTAVTINVLGALRAFAEEGAREPVPGAPVGDPHE